MKLIDWPDALVKELMELENPLAAESFTAYSLGAPEYVLALGVNTKDSLTADEPYTMELQNWEPSVSYFFYHIPSSLTSSLGWNWNSIRNLLLIWAGAQAIVGLEATYSGLLVGKAGPPL